MSSRDDLPQQLTSFIGREREMAEVVRLLGSTRLLTVTGTGGSGKTRLALEVAGSVMGDYPDGVCWVEVTSLEDAVLVPQAVASAFGLREETGRDLLATIAEHIGSRKLLLVLDNCDRLVPACASLAYNLLRACPGLRILATSLQALDIEGEIAWRLPPMSVPDPGRLPPLEEISRYEAVRLFVERATYKCPDFRMTAENARAVARLCHELDGLPLAIELAAARVKVLSVEQIVERLGERFRLLKATGPVSLPRHQTLEALVDWSYGLLSEAERSLLRGLSVFVGGFSLEAVEAVCGVEIDEYEVLDLLTQLVDKSLVVVEERHHAARYRLLETIRQYAWEKLASCGEVAAMRSRHLEWYMSFAEQSEDALLSERQGEWLKRLDAEHDNLRAALANAQGGVRIPEAVDDAETGLRLAGALVWYWYFRGYLTEGRTWLSAMLALEGAKRRDVARAKALSALGALSFLQSDFGEARPLLEESLDIWREIGDKRGSAFALTFLGRVLVRQGDPSARLLGEESVSLFRDVGDKWGIALSLDFLGELARDEGDDRRAAALHEESLALYRQIGDKWGMALEHSNFGRVAFGRGDFASAQARLEEALALQRGVGDKWTIAWTLHNLGDVVYAQGDCERALGHYSEGLALFHELGDKGGAASTLLRLGRCAARKGEDRRAARLFEEGVRLAEELGDGDLVREISEASRHRAGEERGVSLTVQADGALYPVELTRRELEVLVLIAEGLPDAQIAERLVLSPRTVHSHVRSIYSKLGVASRSAATRSLLSLPLTRSGAFAASTSPAFSFSRFSSRACA